MSERLDKREQDTRTKQLPEALNDLQAQIQAHRRHDKRESWLGSAIGYVTTLNSSSNQSLRELEELKKKTENELKSGDKKTSAELSAEIARKIESDRASLDWKDEVTRYTGGFTKTAALFAKGRLGAAFTVGLYGVDQARCGDSFTANLADLGLGAAKGGAMRYVFGKFGESPASPLAKGVTLGILNTALDVGLSRQTYQDKTTGGFSLNSAGVGLGKTLTTSLDPRARAIDGVIFLAGHGIFKGLDHTAGGALARNKMLSAIFSGGSFGLSTGGVGEYMRQQEAGENFDPVKIATRSVLQGGVDSLAAGFGHGVSDPHIRGQVRRWGAEKLEGLRTRADRLQASASTLIDSVLPAPQLGMAGAGGGDLTGRPVETAQSRPRPEFETNDRSTPARTNRTDQTVISDKMFCLRQPGAGAHPVEWLESMKEALVRIDNLHVQDKIEPLREIWKHLERFDRLAVPNMEQAMLTLQVDQLFNNQMRLVQHEARVRARTDVPDELLSSHLAPEKFVTQVIRERMMRSYLWDGSRGTEDVHNTGSSRAGIKVQAELFNNLSDLLNNRLHEQPGVVPILEYNGYTRKRAMDWIGLPSRPDSPADKAGADYILVNRMTGETLPFDSTLKGTGMRPDALVDSRLVNSALSWDGKVVPAERSDWVLCALNEYAWQKKVLEIARRDILPWEKAMGKTREQLQQQLGEIIALSVSAQSPLTLFDAQLPSTDASLPPTRKIYEVFRFRAGLERLIGMPNWADNMRGAIGSLNIQYRIPPGGWTYWALDNVPAPPRPQIKKWRPQTA